MLEIYGILVNSLFKIISTGRAIQYWYLISSIDIYILYPVSKLIYILYFIYIYIYIYIYVYVYVYVYVFIYT